MYPPLTSDKAHQDENEILVVKLLNHDHLPEHAQYTPLGSIPENRWGYVLGGGAGRLLFVSSLYIYRTTRPGQEYLRRRIALEGGNSVTRLLRRRCHVPPGVGLDYCILNIPINQILQGIHPCAMPVAVIWLLCRHIGVSIWYLEVGSTLVL
jgi:hypothetical protein